MDVEKVISKNMISTYYAVFIVLALLPQVFGFNDRGIGDVWKMGILIWLLVLSFIKNKTINLSVIGIAYLFFYMVVNVACLITDFDISITTMFNLVIGVVLIYLFFDWPIREKNISKSDIFEFFRILVWFMLVACIYNMIVNAKQLLNITSISVYGSDATTSFFDNKNTFGVFLLFGTISATFCKIYEGKNKWLYITFLFLVNALMAMSRTAIVLIIFLLIASFLIGDKKTRKSRIFFLSILLFMSIVLYFTSSTISNYIDNNLFGNTQSLDIRDRYIERMLPLARGFYLYFGYGVEKSIQLTIEYAGNRYYHNTYLQLLMEGGLMKLSVFVVGVIYSIRNTIKLCRMNKKIGYMCAATITTYLIYASIESVILFDTPVIAMLASIFVISIPRLFLNAEELCEDTGYRSLQ